MWFVVEIILFLGIVLLGAGYFWKDRRAHVLRTVGWVLFGLFWALQTPFYVASGDVINTIAAGGALLAFGYLGYHEYLSYKWDEEYEPLKFFAGVAFLASIIYFVVERFPVISGGLIKLVADQSAWLSNLGGGSYLAGPIDYAGNSIWYKTTINEVRVPIVNANVDIVLACTGIHAIVATLSVVVFIQTSRIKKLKIIGLLVPTIYIVNLFRNFAIIYFYDGLGWSFEFVHGVIGKAISLVTLFVLVILIFYMLPELYEHINGIFELPWRKEPGHDYKEHVGRVMNKWFKR